MPRIHSSHICTVRTFCTSITEVPIPAGIGPFRIPAGIGTFRIPAGIGKVALVKRELKPDPNPDTHLARPSHICARCACILHLPHRRPNSSWNWNFPNSSWNRDFLNSSWKWDFPNSSWNWESGNWEAETQIQRKWGNASGSFISHIHCAYILHLPH